MIIKGNLVGNIAPRTNWEQTDPEKSDYLKGRDALDQKIATAQNAAATAQSTANTAKTNAATAQSTANTAKTNAATAQSTADTAKANAATAQATANAALPKAGGTMTGAINMGSKKITNLATPTASTDGANKGYVDDKVKVFSGTLTTSGWTVHPGDTGGYYQNVSVSGILTTDVNSKAELNLNDLTTTGADIGIVQARDSAWNEIYRSVIMSNGGVRFYSYEKPNVDLPFRITVWR